MADVTEATGTDSGCGEASGRRSGLGWLGTSSLLWGGLVTWAFYAAIPHSPVAVETLDRYFTAHPLEYVTATLFFLGMATLAIRALALWGEARHGRIVELPGSIVAGGSLARARSLLETTASSGNCRRRTRLHDLCRFVTRRGGGTGISEHGRFLADQAAERMHESYSLVRTITWAVPILGFLGTVIGITMAIAHVTPEQLDTSLTDVTEGLAVAFDTTALALTLSLVLVFSLNGIQRIEQSQLASIESWSLREVAPVLAEPGGSSQVRGSLRQAEVKVAESLLVESEAVIRRQTELWDHSLEELRQRWITALEQQTTDFQTALAQGLGNSLQDHDQKLETLRAEWLEACNGVTAGLVEQTDRVVESLAGGVGECVSGMDQAATVVRDQLGQLQNLGELLLKVIDREEELVGLEQRMVANLEAVRTSEAFEQTLLSLTAAVHLLTARTGSQAA